MTYQEYLKDKDGNIFSPITSSDSVYYKEFTGGEAIIQQLKYLIV